MRRSRRELMRWDPLRELMGVDEEMWGSDFVPATDVRVKENSVVVEMDVPGIDTDNIDVSVEDDVLTVSGKREEKKEVKQEDYFHKEVRSGSFCRSVGLPVRVKSENAEATFKKGVLKITLPKAEEARPKKIAVSVKE